MSEKRQTFRSINSALDTLRYYNRELKRNAWLEYDRRGELWTVVWEGHDR